MSEETVELEDMSVEAETDLALLCNIDDKKHWIPKSVVHEDSEVSSEGDTGTIVLQRDGLPRKKGWSNRHMQWRTRSPGPHLLAR
jgi:hypothetical protein